MCAMPWVTCLRSFFLNVFFLPFFSGVPPAAAGFAITFLSSVIGVRRQYYEATGERPTTVLVLFRSVLLLRDRALARSFTGARVGMGTLSTNRQIPAMAVSTIRSDFDEPLDIHRNVFTQIAFDRTFRFDDLSDAVYFIFAQILNFLRPLDVRLLKNARSARMSNAVNVS